MRYFTTLAALVMSAGTAAADHQTYYPTTGQPQLVSPTFRSGQMSPRDLPWNQQPQTEERYQLRNKLTEVRLDGFRDRAYIQLPVQRGLDYLELRAGATPIALTDVVVRFADGTEIHTGSRGIVEPFQGRVIDLPHGSSPVALIPQYDLTRRRGGRLEIFGVHEHRWHNRY
jgi:hypothetical protein